MPIEPHIIKKESITVAFMVEKLDKRVGVSLETLCEIDAERRLVTERVIHRPGLALAGYVRLFTHQRVQVLGNMENLYLKHLPIQQRITAFENLIQFPIPCIFLTNNNELDAELLQRAVNARIPVYRTELPTTKFMSLLQDFLSDQFAQQCTVHAALVDVYGIGLLITGRSGIGKSEVALDLVERGHRLVADDVVVVTKKDENLLMGSGTDLVQHFMEIRGLGIVDVRAMFGVRAIRFQKRIEVVVDMEDWDSEEEYTRLGMVSDSRTFLDVALPLVKLPIIPGKNVTVICEVIAMNHLLRHYGYDPAEIFSERLGKRISEKSGQIRRGIEYFEHDYE